MKRRTFCIGCLFAAISPALPAIAAEPIRATLYKNPQCTCCEGYASYLRSNGFVGSGRCGAVVAAFECIR